MGDDCQIYIMSFSLGIRIRSNAALQIEQVIVFIIIISLG